MKRLRCGTQIYALLVLAAVMTSSCIFDPFIEFDALEGEGSNLVTISLTTEASECEIDEMTQEEVCTYHAGESYRRASVFGVLGLAFALFDYFFDPILLQLPAEAS